MSLSRLRVEKDCLNCGIIVQGIYCHNCGQENRISRETFWGLVHHFFAGITYFDGKFFTTLVILIKKPGFLSKEFIIEKRNSYLNPIRMYVFSSAIFFLIFFTFFHVDNARYTAKDEKLAKGINDIYASAETKEDSLKIDQLTAYLNRKGRADKDTTNIQPDENKNWKIINGGVNFNSQEEYDSAQHALPRSQRDGWFKRSLIKKGIYINSKYENKKQEFWKDIINKFIHSFPSFLFVSLPCMHYFLQLPSLIHN